jgi:hypothetical protein
MSARRVAGRAVRHVSNALNALLVATFKMGTLRQRLLVFGNAAPGGGVGGALGTPKCEGGGAPGRAMRDLLPRGILAAGACTIVHL